MADFFRRHKPPIDPMVGRPVTPPPKKDAATAGCPDCGDGVNKGSGKNPDGDLCTYCDGTGLV